MGVHGLHSMCLSRLLQLSYEAVVRLCGGQRLVEVALAAKLLLGSRSSTREPAIFVAVQDLDSRGIVSGPDFHTAVHQLSFSLVAIEGASQTKPSGNLFAAKHSF